MKNRGYWLSLHKLMTVLQDIRGNRNFQRIIDGNRGKQPD